MIHKYSHEGILHIPLPYFTMVKVKEALFE